MKLKVFKNKTTNEIVGQQAIIVKDDINGSNLVLQSGRDQLIIKLSDLLELIQEQEKEGRDGTSEAE